MSSQDDYGHIQRGTSSGSAMSLSPFPPPAHQHPLATSSNYFDADTETAPSDPLLPYAHKSNHSTAALNRYPTAPDGIRSSLASKFATFSLGWRSRGPRFKLAVILITIGCFFLVRERGLHEQKSSLTQETLPLTGDFEDVAGNESPVVVEESNEFDVIDGDDDFNNVDQIISPAQQELTTSAKPAAETSTKTNNVEEATPTSPEEVSTASATATKAAEPISPEELPILEEPIQPRRPIRPSFPNPWSDLPLSWIGHNLLSEQRFPDLLGLQDAPKNALPPARFLMKAFEFQAWTAKKPSTKASFSSRMASPKWDEFTGRPLKVPREEIEPFLFPKKWKRPTIKGEIEGEDDPDSELAVEEQRRQKWVKRAFLHAWEGYKKFAWGHDELLPVSQKGSNKYNGWGATIVDNLDTLLLMNLTHEYNLARKHVEEIDFSYLVPSGAKTFSTELPNLEELDLPETASDDQQQGPPRFFGGRFGSAADQNSPQTIPHFETTIRYLGGLLSAYELTGRTDRLMLQRAIELGDWLLPALGTMDGLAVGRYILGSNPKGSHVGRVILSEVGSLTLEFTKLSMLTGDETYYQAVQRSMDTLDKAFAAAPAAPVLQDADEATKSRQEAFLVKGRLGTLLPAYIDSLQPKQLAGEYTFGGLSDSYVEYLLKQAQLAANSLPQFQRMYENAIDSAHKFLIKPVTTIAGRPEFIGFGTRIYGRLTLTADHLTCFAGGMLSLGSKLFQGENESRDLKSALGFTETCQWAYESSPSGLGPESISFYNEDDASRYIVLNDKKGEPHRKLRGHPPGVKTMSPQFIGRPETIESIFYMWRVTGDRKWQDYGWNMFTNWMQHSITPAGFASLNAINLPHPSKKDSQESFVLAETLKYYFLLFSPRNLISLDDYVFNTEAHPFKIPKYKASKLDNFWAGPDEGQEIGINDLRSSQGEGTFVQKWARVHQAKGLLNLEKEAIEKSKLLPKPAAGLTPLKDTIPPGKNSEEVEEARRLAHLAAMAQGGGGRGMGGGLGRKPVDAAQRKKGET